MSYLLHFEVVVINVVYGRLLKRKQKPFPEFFYTENKGALYFLLTQPLYDVTDKVVT